MLTAAAAAEECFGAGFGLLCLFLAVHHLRQFKRQNFLGLVQLAAFPLVHLIDLLERQERQHTDTFHNIGIIDVAPVLIKFKRTGLIRVEPDSISGGLAHLLALRVRQKRDGHGVRVLAKLAANEFRTAQHV